MGRLVKHGWLSPQALHAADLIGRLDPAEGLGIVAWLVRQLGSGHLEISGRRTVSHWLQQLAFFASQVAAQMQAAPDRPQ